MVPFGGVKVGVSALTLMRSPRFGRSVAWLNLIPVGLGLPVTVFAMSGTLKETPAGSVTLTVSCAAADPATARMMRAIRLARRRVREARRVRRDRFRIIGRAP